MTNEISEAKTTKKKSHPLIKVLDDIPFDKRGALTISEIRKINSKTGSKISFDGDKVILFAPNENSFRDAKEMIQRLVVGQVN
jgi:hypothetical protein